MKNIAVIGGGAAGLMAAGTAKELGAQVTLFEKNQKFGRKLAITGKGRCNVTNNCSAEEFFSNVIANSKFMLSSYNSFTSQDTMDFFQSRGVMLKTERGGRVFPCSDRSSDIVNVLASYASRCQIIKEKVTSIEAENGQIKTVKTAKNSYDFDAVIVCTGGLSYPITGSDGDGYRFAQRLGHSVVLPKPSLVPIEVCEAWCKDLQGLSLKNVAIKVKYKDKIEYSDFGEMLFTHFGVSGPIILSASANMKNSDLNNYSIEIDLKPALDFQKLNLRVQSDFEKYSLRNFDNALSDLLPQKLIFTIIKLSGIDPKTKVYQISKSSREELVRLLKNLTLTVKCFRPIDEAIITRGGVSVKEINPKTMESKLVHGLYFCGEILDVDACTGGFNLQIAFSSARAAAIHAST